MYNLRASVSSLQKGADDERAVGTHVVTKETCTKDCTHTEQGAKLALSLPLFGSRPGKH